MTECCGELKTLNFGKIGQNAILGLSSHFSAGLETLVPVNPCVLSFTTGWTWEHGAAAAASLLGCRTWHTPAKLCRRADVTLELWAFVFSDTVWLLRP